MKRLYRSVVVSANAVSIPILLEVAKSQTQANKDAMTSTELRAILARLGLTQMGAAKLLGVGGRTFRRWVLNEAPIPEVVARVMRAADAGRLDLNVLMEAAR